MTRYSGLAYKRSHHEAGFEDNSEQAVADERPWDKKRKFRAESSSAGERQIASPWKDKSIRDRALKTEARRQKRVDERSMTTTCFACREQGHTARDCPKSLASDGGQGMVTANAVGICYRCGSRRHTLNRCRAFANERNPLPFAVCFVCSSKGHLASSCPKNQGKGVYPDGGCCKLCGQTTHLARNCEMRKSQPGHQMIIVPDGELGADEDDFHALKRRQLEVDKDEKLEHKAKAATRALLSQSRSLPIAKPTNVVAF